jgi:methyltransferase
LILTQRVVELAIAKRHERELKKIGAVEADKNGYRFIVGMHTAFFISLFLEKMTLDRALNQWWIILTAIFCAAQALRYWAITSLGVYWNTKILVVPNHPLIRNGPYKFLRHPNYIGVMIELAMVPLIFSCYITSIAFTIINALVIRRRIRIEMQALKDASQ